MKIFLLRHGKPVIPSLKRLNAFSFKKWLQEYNKSGIDSSSKPDVKVLRQAKECKAIVCSDLPRSIESAKVIDAKKIVLTHSMFNEAGLPVANWYLLKLPPKAWAIIFRFYWLLGYSKDSESFKESKVRAKKAVEKLTKISGEYESVLFVGHGVYNRILANELRSSGWSCLKSPGSKHWSIGIYEYKDKH